MKQDINATFGEFVKRCRIARRLSRRGLAAKAGLDNGALTRLEQGKVRQPKLETLQCLSRALEVPFPEMCAMAGYVAAYDLPSITLYLRARYSHLPEDKIRQADAFFQKLIEDHRLDPRGPIGNEDEHPPRASAQQH